MTSDPSFYAQLHPLAQFNLRPGAAGPNGTSAAGAALPGSSASVNSADGGDAPWHPDSPLFWLALLCVASLTGIVGASVNLKAGPAKAGAKLGK